jgi:hypothetical protein
MLSGSSLIAVASLFLSELREVLKITLILVVEDSFEGFLLEVYCRHVSESRLNLSESLQYWNRK